MVRHNRRRVGVATSILKQPRRSVCLFLFLLLANLCQPAGAVTPASQLLPSSTCLYISFPDMDELQKRFDRTQLGKLAQDPVMKPFAEDLAHQLRERFGQTDLQLGVTWNDLKGVYAGARKSLATKP